jgi:ornithine cyclodeaminase/alanine dehydrogenase-like protein (mu-crystallin family)
MKVRIINQAEVTRLLPMNECIEVMEQVLKAQANGDAILPLRTSLRTPEQNSLTLMPSYLRNIQSVGVKVISVFPGNHGTQYDAHQGVVLVFETDHGILQAIVDATSVTAIRTPAVSGVATKLLARQDAGDLAILGAGTQAQGHLEAMLEVRKIRRVRVWSLPMEQAQEFARRESNRLKIKVEVMESAQQAVEGADLICTTTSAREPILKGEWIRPGAHINAVGSSIPAAREVDTPAVAKSQLFVDRRESTLNEAGDFLFPKKEGVIGDDHIRAELGEILTGRAQGRKTEEEITLFKSLGLAIEDLASAHYIHAKAVKMNVGIEVELGGGHFASSK